MSSSWGCSKGMTPTLTQPFLLTNLVFLLLLFAYVPQVGVIFNYILAHLIHSVHEQLKALPQMITERQKVSCW